MNIKSELARIIQKVFDNEEDFMKEVYLKDDPTRIDDELVSFYMASERCKLCMVHPSGRHYTDSVKTQDVLDWEENL